MNKLLALVNIELKRNSKFYLIYVALFSFFSLSISLIQINRLKKSIHSVQNMVDSFGGITYGAGILYKNYYVYPLIFIGLVGLLIYSIYMWLREYIDSNKSIYTLIMIPENKFNIYLSKMIALITMIYGYLITQILMIFISKNVFNLYFKNMNLIKSSFIDDLFYGTSSDFGFQSLARKLIPLEFTEFIMYYVIFLVLAISLIFTVCIIGISLRESSKLLVLVSIPVGHLFYVYILNRFSLNLYYIIGSLYKTFLNAHLTINLITIIVLNLISYVLINKKFYI